jgi:1-acyl-sn-glycerol-3-phosphate acyltransferase
MNKFKEIRPYLDDEIRPVLDNLINNPELVSAIAGFYSPKLARWFPACMRTVARHTLKRQLKGVHDVESVQHVIARYMGKMIEDTTTSVTHSGMENLQDGNSYLFISNHRDITMDPAFVNYMLYQAGHKTLQIAIGDNLLKKPYVSDLMRLNKSFIVKRSHKGRELLQSLTLLSEYIHYCIGSGQNVWIAQREGRAKDGIDKTDPTLLKMLAMAERKQPLSETLSKLHIIPVAISYEYDACDVLKAEELYEFETQGSFTKTDKSDIHSIVTGMIGFKGQVHIAFGEELSITSDDPDVIAADIDTQILRNYRLRDINFLALERLQEAGLMPLLAPNAEIEAVETVLSSRTAFEQRLLQVDPKLHRHYLLSYANSVLSFYRLQFQDGKTEAETTSVS